MAFNLVSAEQIKAINLDNPDLPEDSGSGMTIKVDTAANLKQENPVLLKGQLGAESDTTYMKLGNGVTAWNDLEYIKADKSVQDAAGNVITDTYVPKKEIRVSADLDTLKETGFYNFPLSSICTEANHFPWEVASAVLVIRNGANGDGCTQICFPYNQEKFWKRTYLASTQKWHDWDTSAFMADLTSKQDKLVFDTTPTENSMNAITSGAVKAYVDQAIAKITNANNKSY